MKKGPVVVQIIMVKRPKKSNTWLDANKYLRACLGDNYFSNTVF
jgi:hypothetical protein